MDSDRIRRWRKNVENFEWKDWARTVGGVLVIATLTVIGVLIYAWIRSAAGLIAAVAYAVIVLSLVFGTALHRSNRRSGGRHG